MSLSLAGHFIVVAGLLLLFVATSFFVISKPAKAGVSSVITIPVAGFARGATYDPANKYVYVLTDGGIVAVVDTNTRTVVANITLKHDTYSAPFMTSIVYDPDNGKLYVVDQNLPGLVVIDGSTNQEVGNIVTSQVPTDVTYGNGKLYLPISYANVINVIDSQSGALLANVTAGIRPVMSAYDPADKLLYVTNQKSNSTSVLDTVTDKIVATIPVGNGPTGVAYGSNGKVYVAD